MLEFKQIPFDPTQRLYLLKAGANSSAALHPEAFRKVRLDRERSTDSQETAPDQDLWLELTREQLLADAASDGRSLRRLALTTEAGMGKTYNLRWLCHQLSDKNRRQIAVYHPIGSLSGSFSVATLVDTFLIAAGYSESERARLERSLERMRQRGELVLLFDGLDMASKESVQVLAHILERTSEWSRCRIVIAGRPSALEAFWGELFKTGEWTFAQITEFDEAQQRLALGQLEDGTERYDHVPSEACGILTTPRVLEYLRPLQAAELVKLQTVSDVYWQACTYMLKRALQQTGEGGQAITSVTWDRYLATLGALAFSMYAQVFAGPESKGVEPNLDRIQAVDITGFFFTVLDRLEQTNLRITEELLGEKILPGLTALNTVLNHGWFDNQNLAEQGKDLLWRNASLQEFFAACWISRWAGPKDVELLGNWIVNPLTDQNRGFYWLWRYASEMPPEAVDRKAWVGAMSPLYQPAAPVRSTEFIYRSWDRMKEWAGSVVEDFLAEFSRLAKNGTPKQRQICREITGGFKRIDEGICHYQADHLKDPPNPGEPRQVAAFSMHQWPVTNLMYESFDPGHKDFRWRYWKDDKAECAHPLSGADGNGDDYCPVVNVSWYDASVFAVWCGCRLPNELEWEHAARRGTAERWFLGIKSERQLKKYAHFDQPYGTGHTVPVNDGRRLPNDNGLFDMAGNVREWCVHWYDQEALARVLRGGSWYYFGRRCRSAFRFWFEPDRRDHDYGFRLAAVPCIVGAKSSRSVGDGAAGEVESE